MVIEPLEYIGSARFVRTGLGTAGSNGVRKRTPTVPFHAMRESVWISGATTAQSVPRWYLWEGGFLVIAQAGGEVPAHAHHAIQLFLALDGAAAIRTADGEWREGRGIIVRPDVEHSFNPRGAAGALLFVDPETSEGAWLQAALADDITLLPAERLQRCLAELQAFCERPLQSMDAGDLVRHCVQAFCAGAPPSRRLDGRITTLLKKIGERDELRISLEEAAELVHLSPGRFAHLFKEQLGLPYRRYLLWRKLLRAMLAIGRESNIAAAAHASDFADAAHLTRTFHQMFGIPPSVMMKGEFYEIASPFAAAA
jgi:AraC-like DNA-binding protein